MWRCVSAAGFQIAVTFFLRKARSHFPKKKNCACYALKEEKVMFTGNVAELILKLETFLRMQIFSWRMIACTMKAQLAKNEE